MLYSYRFSRCQTLIRTCHRIVSSFASTSSSPLYQPLPLSPFSSSFSSFRSFPSMSVQPYVASESKPLIAVDLDEVLGQFLPAVIKWHNEEYDTNHTLTDYFSYHFAYVWGCSDEEGARRLEEFFASPYFVNDIEVMPFAKETIEDLADSYDFAIVTSRQLFLKEITYTWINKYYPQLFKVILFGNHYGVEGQKYSKPQMLQSLGATAIIDDSLLYTTQCAAIAPRVVLYDWNSLYAWNKIENQNKKSQLLSNTPAPSPTHTHPTHSHPHTHPTGSPHHIAGVPPSDVIQLTTNSVTGQQALPANIHRFTSWKDIGAFLKAWLKEEDKPKPAAVLQKYYAQVNEKTKENLQSTAAASASSSSSNAETHTSTITISISTAVEEKK